MNNTLEIFRKNDALSAAADAGEQLNSLLLEHKTKPVLLMLSSGSALSLLDYVGQTTLGENLTVSMLDERFSVDESVNNFSQLQKTEFYTQALEADVSFFGTLPRHDDTMESLKTRWETDLKTWTEENPKGLIIATLGLGKDGHTAGIFPEADEKKFKAMFESENWVAAHDVGEKNQYPKRITATLTFLKKIDFALAYVVGQEKKEKLDAVILKQGKINELPALGCQEIKDVKIFTDTLK